MIEEDYKKVCENSLAIIAKSIIGKQKVINIRSEG